MTTEKPTVCKHCGKDGFVYTRYGIDLKQFSESELSMIEEVVSLGNGEYIKVSYDELEEIQNALNNDCIDVDDLVICASCNNER